MHILITYPRAPVIAPFHSRIICFRNTRLMKTEYIESAPNDIIVTLEHLTAEGTLYTPSTYHRGPNIAPFSLR